MEAITITKACIDNRINLNSMYTVNHKKRDILFLTNFG